MSAAAKLPVEPRVLFEDKSLAHVMCGHCPATVHPQVAERSNVFKRRIYEFGPNTYAAIEYVGCSVMVVGPEGAVVVGAVDQIDSGTLVAGHFEKLRKGTPIAAVVYNDSLADNYGGVEAFVSESEVKSGAVSIIAHESFERMLKNIGDVGNIHTWRAAYQAGAFLEKGPEGLVHTGAIAFKPGKVSYIAPNVLVGKSWKGAPGGVRTEIYHFPAESDDGIVTWFPDQKTLVIGHVLFGDLLPQVYAQRGIVRKPKRWYKGIEDLIDFVNNIDVEYMVPMHFFEPIVGRERIMEVLNINRDTLQFIADQGARYINKGYRPDDLAVTVSLPPHLATHRDLQEHYGRLQQHMRQQYHDHLGWFQGDPTFLDALPAATRAQNYVEALGGRNGILEKVDAAIEQKQDLWAAELLGWLIQVNPEDDEARRLKAGAFRRLGFAAPNATYRNWFLTSALEMEGRLPQLKLDKSAMIPEQILKGLGVLDLLETLKPRLMSEQTFDLDCRINIHCGDDVVSAHLRRGVLESRPWALDESDLTLRASIATLREVIENQKTVAAALAAGEVTVEQGDASLLQRLAGMFEPSAGGNYPVSVPTVL